MKLFDYFNQRRESYRSCIALLPYVLVHIIPAYVTVTFICLFSTTSAIAVNWLMLQGTEHPFAAEHKFWGFIQPAYTHDTSNNLSGLTDSAGPPDFSPNNGKRLAITSVSPWFENNSEFHIRRAKFGVRGIFTGALRNRFTTKMNYFTLFEVAPNLMTYDPFGERARVIALDHLSLSFNHSMLDGAMAGRILSEVKGLIENGDYSSL